MMMDDNDDGDDYYDYDAIGLRGPVQGGYVYLYMYT